MRALLEDSLGKIAGFVDLAMLDVRAGEAGAFAGGVEVALVPAEPELVEPLGGIEPRGMPGISLVTCAMNRSENLMRALPSWLAHSEVAEVLIVDWSSVKPVAESLAEAGIDDPRIRVARVEGEPRWVLSYAFNLGFRAARFDTILKADADIVLAEDFFARNRLEPGTMIAGNWREAAPDQPFVNGFFLAEKAALAGVTGFNEHITSYGWDDEDLYARMVIEGVRRVNVAPDTIHHLPHSDDERLGPLEGEAQEAGGATADDTAGDAGQDLSEVLRAPMGPSARMQIRRDTQFLIRRNRFVASTMPDWNGTSILLPFDILRQGPGGMVLRRTGWVPSEVPAHIEAAADTHAWRELLSWRLGRGALALDGPGLDAVLGRPDDEVSAIDVAIAKVSPEKVIRGRGRYLVVGLGNGVFESAVARPGGAAALERLVERARGLGLTPVFRLDHSDWPAGTPEVLAALPAVPSWEPMGEPAPVTAEAMISGEVARGRDLALQAGGAGLELLGGAAPVVIRPRARIFIDAQHGLGNRLRAIGSAAAIARADHRELVILWQPDEHCDCRFSDLFDYDGAVVEERFLEDAQAKGWEVLNYMATEPGAEKDRPVDLGSGRDIYARSAFVLNAEASNWEAENAFLKALTPVEAVRGMVEAVRHPNHIAAHVRMQGGAAHEHLPYERPDNWSAEDHAAIAHWREKSHFAHFLQRIDRLAAEGEAETLFVAADLPETYEVFRQHYGERVAWLPRSLYDRSSEQLLYGLADAILLSRAPRLLGSTWSSFSELAMRLSPQAQKVEMSGTDF